MTVSKYLSGSIKGLLLLLIGSYPALGLIIDGYSSALWYLLGALGMGALALRIKLRQPLLPNREPKQLLGLIIGFVALSALVYVFLDQSDFSKSRLERHLLLLIVPLVYYLLWSTQLRQRELLLSFSLSGIIFFIYAAFFHKGGRLDGLVHAIHFGNVALITMICSLASVLLMQHPATKLLGVIGTLGAAAAFFESGSRGGAVALILSVLAVAFFLTVIHGHVRYLLVAGLVLIITSYAALQFVEPVEQRYNATVDQWESVAEGNMQNSIGLRFLMWDAAWEQVEENWLFGGGFSTYRQEIRNRIETGQLPANMEIYASEPHNQFLYQAASHGIVGLIAYLLIFAVPAVQLCRRYNRASRMERVLCATYLVFLVAFLTFGLTITLFDQRKVIQFFGIVYVMLALFLNTPTSEPEREHENCGHLDTAD